MNKFETGLSRDPANFVPLTPIGFLRRAAAVFPDKTAVIHGDATYSYHTFYDRCRRLASALEQRGIGKGDTVSVMAPNVPALLEAHYACPMIGAVLNAINFRLDPRTVAFILAHGESKLIITDRSLSDTMGPALEALGRDIAVIERFRPRPPRSPRRWRPSSTGDGDPDRAWE